MSRYGGKRLATKPGAKRHTRGGKRLQSTKRGGVRLLCGLALAVGTMALAAWTLPLGAFPGAAGLPAADLPVQKEPISQEDAEGNLPPQQENEADNRFLLSFAGDCTLGVEHNSWGKSGTFPAVVQENYDYPFSGVRDLFSADDFTFVNLECALTDHNVPAEKEYRFRGLPAYGEILTAGSVEAVTLANNHSLDYGTTGLTQTRQVLADRGIAAGGDGETFLYTTSRGLKIGVYTAYHFGKAEIRKAIETLQTQGAEVIVAAFHAGVEGSYEPSDRQKELFRYAVDCGADIVYNSHPHVLQPIEYRGEGVILYSLGNFCFGGNRNPSDKDTAVIQIAVERQEDGTVKLAEVTAIPCSVSSRSDRNDYCPTPYTPDSKEAARVESKLAGTYQAPAPKTQPKDEQADAESSTSASALFIHGGAPAVHSSGAQNPETVECAPGESRLFDTPDRDSARPVALEV